MSKRPRRKFETGFKKQLVAQIQAGQITATEAARAHSISSTVISYWRKQFQAGYPLLLWGERKKWTPAKRYFKQNNTPS